MEKEISKEMLRRLEDSFTRLKVIHTLRWEVLEVKEKIKYADLYIEDNELFSEKERRICEYIGGYSYTLFDLKNNILKELTDSIFNEYKNELAFKIVINNIKKCNIV